MKQYNLDPYLSMFGQILASSECLDDSSPFIYFTLLTDWNAHLFCSEMPVL